MRNYPNIEKYPFQGKTYIGYGNGVWRIIRCGRQWVATKQQPYTRIVADTLGEISEQLQEHKHEALSPLQMEG